MHYNRNYQFNLVKNMTTQLPKARDILSVLIVLIVLLCYQAAAQAQSLTVVSFGGSYSRACEKGYHERFEAETGININFEDYNGGLAQIRAQVDVGNVYWDVVDLQIPDLVRGCDEGLLVPIEINDLSPGAGWYARGG